MNRNRFGSSPRGKHEERPPDILSFQFLCWCGLWLIIASVVIYVLGVIAFGGSLFLNSKPNPLKANTPNTISSKSRTGLYASAKYVQEIYGEKEFQKLLKEKQHIVAVFYASWCGHCRNFAPKFQAIAERITQKVSDLNSEDLSKRYPVITFAAVDCVAYREICEKNEINAYPTVLPFNFPSMKTRAIRINGVEDEIIKILKTFVFSHEELETSLWKKLDTKMKKEESPKSHYQYPLSHFVSAEDKWKEGCTSFQYFLLNELPHFLPSANIKVLEKLSRLIYAISQEEAFANVHGYLLEMDQKNPSGLQISNSTKTDLKKLFLNKKVEWNSCSIPNHQGFKLRSSVTTFQAETGSVLGYSCGLWLLFHSLSVNAQAVEKALEPKDIMNLMHAFISEFFGCIDCRSHFLEYYDKCLFGRCKLQSFSDLQLWLFYLHNFVTMRIHLEQNNHFLTPDILKSALERYLWPPINTCPTCYNPTILTKANSLSGSFKTQLESLLSNHSVNLNQKYHKKEMNSLLVEIIPQIIPDLFVSQEILHFLQKSFAVKDLIKK